MLQGKILVKIGTFHANGCICVCMCASKCVHLSNSVKYKIKSILKSYDDLRLMCRVLYEIQNIKMIQKEIKTAFAHQDIKDEFLFILCV